MQKSRKTPRLGVRGRLLLAFLAICTFSLIGAASGFYSLSQVGGSLSRITDEQVPQALSSLELSRQAERVVRAAPALLLVTTEEERVKTSAEIAAQAERLNKLLGDLGTHAGRDEARSAASVRPMVEHLNANLAALEDLVEQRLSIGAKLAGRIHLLTQVAITAESLLSPGVRILEAQLAEWGASPGAEDSRQLSIEQSGDARSIISLVPQEKARGLIEAINNNILMTSRAEKPTEIDLLLFPLRKSLTELSKLSQNVPAPIKVRLAQQVNSLAALAVGPLSVAAVRNDELAILDQAKALLTVNAQLSTDLTNEVSRLVAQANSDIANARSQASSLQAVNRNVLLAVVVLSLASSILIVWLYVGRNLIRRLTALSESMLDIAGGNLRAPLPAPIGGDEIAEMTRALVVFRNTAVEIEENNLREIALARQRLVEALESISEGFALYDAEDLLVLSNHRYREVASPADPEAIGPGVTFESVIRRVAALGAVDTAGHRNEDWIAQRMAAHLRRDGLSLLYEHRDRWLQVSERPAGNGGLVVVWTDVTALKQGEILLREAFDRINKELAAARQLQLSMVPRHFPAWSEAQPIEIQAAMEPAREVGGDLYDFFLAAPGKFCFVVGDVSGKGTAAALFMARTRSLVRATVALWRQTTGAVPAPSAIMQAVNRELCLDNSERMFVTVFLATLDLATGEVAYANAGHPVPYLMSLGSPPIAIPAPPDVPLGIQSRANFHDRSMALREQEALFLVTDGVLDALNPSEEFFGKSRLTDTLAGFDGDPPSAIVSGVLKAIDDFADGTPRFDDVTLLALRWSRSAPLVRGAGDSAAQSKAL